MSRIQRFGLVVVMLIATHTAVAGQREVLVGRWRSDTAPTGYYIIDRFSDGRFATKGYLFWDLSKPAEVEMEWGRWTLRGGNYSETLTGSTSAFIRRFVGKRLVFQVDRVSSNHFAFETHDGATRDEQRQQVRNRFWK